MISIPNKDTLSATLCRPLPPPLRILLDEIATTTMEAGLQDLTYIVVVELCDTEEAVADEIGFVPTTNPIDGIRYGDPSFQPYWAHLRQQGGWYELTHTISNDGFAFILLIDANSDDDLRRMCREYAGAHQ